MSTLIFLVVVLLLSVAARGSVVAAGIGSGDVAENPPVPMPTFHGVNIHFTDPMPGEVQQLKQGFQGCRMVRKIAHTPMVCCLVTHSCTAASGLSLGLH